MILGERAGEIESIRYVDSTDKVRVNLGIDPKMSDQIFADSIVRQDRKFGLGTPILMIRRGERSGDARKPLPPGSPLRNYEGESDRLDKVASQFETVSESIRLIQQQLDPTLLSMTAASEQLSSTLVSGAEPAMLESQRAAGSIFETSEALRPKTIETLDMVQSATRTLEEKISDLTQSVAASADRVGRAADSVGKTSDDTNRDIAETLASLRDAADQVQRLAVQTQELVRILRGEANDLPGTTEKLNETVSDTQQLVGEIRSHWLLRNSRNRDRSSSPGMSSSTRGGSVRP